MADAAPSLMLNNASALRAGPEHALLPYNFIFVAIRLLVLSDCLGNSVSAGNNFVLAKTCRFVTADAYKLLDDRFR